MSSRRTSSVPKEDVVFPRMLNCDSRCSETLPSLSPVHPGALLCNATHRLGDGKCVILRQRVRGSVRAVRAVRNTWVFQTETGVVADGQVTILKKRQVAPAVPQQKKKEVKKPEEGTPKGPKAGGKKPEVKKPEVKKPEVKKLEEKKKEAWVPKAAAPPPPKGQPRQAPQPQRQGERTKRETVFRR
jgi:hypothetical protein